MAEVNLSEKSHVDDRYNPSGLRGFSMESLELLEDSGARLYVPTHAVSVQQQENPSLESRIALVELPNVIPNPVTATAEAFEPPVTDQQ